MYADIMFKTPGKHRFVGYAKIYLGDWSFWISIFMGVVEMILVMTIYLILSESFLNLIHPGNDSYSIIIFWLLGSIAIFSSLKKLAFIEFLISLSMISIIVLIGFLGLKNIPNMDLGTFNFLPDFKSLKSIALPLSPILFSLSGSIAIPSVVEYFKTQRINRAAKFLRRSIILGTVIPTIFYIIFIFGILSISKNVSEDSVTGLINYVPEFFLVLTGFLGILCLWSSYIAVGSNIESVLKMDLSFRSLTRIFTVIFVPICLYFLGLKNFIDLIGIIGGIFLGLEGMFIILMWLRMNKRVKFQGTLIGKNHFALVIVSMIVFSGALLLEILKNALHIF